MLAALKESPHPDTARGQYDPEGCSSFASVWQVQRHQLRPRLLWGEQVDLARFPAQTWVVRRAAFLTLLRVEVEGLLISLCYMQRVL